MALKAGDQTIVLPSFKMRLQKSWQQPKKSRRITPVPRPLHWLQSPLQICLSDMSQLGLWDHQAAFYFLPGYNQKQMTQLLVFILPACQMTCEAPKHQIHLKVNLKPHYATFWHTNENKWNGYTVHYPSMIQCALAWGICSLETVFRHLPLVVGAASAKPGDGSEVKGGKSNNNDNNDGKQSE